MPRLPRVHSARTLGLLLVCGTGVLAGCSALGTAIWIFKDGKTSSAEYSDLNKKKVAVVCRGPAQNRFRQEQRAPQQIAKRLGSLLRENLNGKTTIIPQEKIAKVTDEKDWEHFTDVGKEVGAERVVAIDMEQFTFHRGSGIYKGTASISVTVYNMEAEGKEVYNKRFDNIVFPPVMEGLPATDMTETQFMDKFINYLATNMGKSFYDFDPRFDFASNGL